MNLDCKQTDMIVAAYENEYVVGDWTWYDMCAPDHVYVASTEELGFLPVPPFVPIFRKGRLLDNRSVKDMIPGDCVFMDRRVYSSLVGKEPDIPHALYEGGVHGVMSPILVPILDVGLIAPPNSNK